MKKQVIIVVITAVVVSLLDFGIFYLCKDSLFKDNNSSKTNNENTNTTDNENKDFTSNGTYVVTYTDKAIENDYATSVPSILTIHKDNTYEFLYNRCDQIVLVKGNYEVKGLDKDLTFTIVNDNEVYLNEWLSCTIGKEDYNNGYGSFKKIY